ncbi:MAG: hypothetical protein HON23_01585, partial [Rickettsiales bacterium]|nr:hypothetical protein [Rickettsiales bacterium]
MRVSSFFDKKNKGKAAGKVAEKAVEKAEGEAGSQGLKKSYKDFQSSRDDFPIYYLDKEGDLRVVKTEIEGLSGELRALDIDGVVFDSESAQKPSKKNDALIKGMKDELLKYQLSSKLESPKKSSLAPNVKSFLGKVSAEYGKRIGLEELLTKLINGLEWKQENINGQNGSPANLLGVEIDNLRFTRSARFDSTAKLKEVIDASMRQEYEALDSEDRLSPEKSKSFTKAEAQEVNGDLKSQGIHLHLDMLLYEGVDEDVKVDHSQFVMDMNLISAMDSTKGGEKNFWQNLDQAYLALPDRHEANRGAVRLGKTFLTESSQSSYAGGRIAAMQGIGNKVSKRASQCADRIAILRQQENIYGA